MSSVSASLQLQNLAPKRCETLAQLAVSLGDMLKDTDRGPQWRFALVLDSIDRQREGPVTLLPALARLSEMVLGAQRVEC